MDSYISFALVLGGLFVGLSILDVISVYLQRLSDLKAFGKRAYQAGEKAAEQKFKLKQASIDDDEDDEGDEKKNDENTRYVSGKDGDAGATDISCDSVGDLEIDRYF